MCGRYNITPNAEAFVDAFEIIIDLDILPDKPRYNIVPSGDPVPVVRHESEQRELCQLRWPLIPHCAKEGRIKFATATPPTSALREIHNRMPLIVPAHAYHDWLQGDDPGQLIQPYAGDLEFYRVSTFVNNPRNDDRRCIESA